MGAQRAKLEAALAQAMPPPMPADPLFGMGKPWSRGKQNFGRPAWEGLADIPLDELEDDELFAANERADARSFADERQGERDDVSRAMPFGLGPITGPTTNTLMSSDFQRGVGDLGGDILGGILGANAGDDTGEFPRLRSESEQTEFDAAPPTQTPPWTEAQAVADIYAPFKAIGEGVDWVSQQASESTFPRDQYPGGDFAGGLGALAFEYAPAIAQEMTFGPGEREREDRYQSDYLRALGDEEGALEAERAANEAGMWHTLNVAAAPFDAVAAAQGVRSLASGMRLGAPRAARAAEEIAPLADDAFPAEAPAAVPDDLPQISDEIGADIPPRLGESPSAPRAPEGDPLEGVSPIRAYHGTGADIEDGFGPGSHFGTSDAANARLRDERVTEGARVYPVDLPQGRYLRVPDAGHSWRSGRYWQESARKELNAAIPPEERAVWRAIENDRELSMARGEEVTTRLGQILREHGFEGGVYRNRWEGGESYFMPDTGGVRSATSRKRAPEGGGDPLAEVSPPARRLGDNDPLAGVALGAGAGGATALSLGGEAEAQEGDSSGLAAAQADVDKLEADAALLARASASRSPESPDHPQSERLIEQAQAMLQGRGLYDYDVDGDWGGVMRGASSEFETQNAERLEEARARVTEFELLGQTPDPFLQTARVAAPWAVGLGALGVGHYLRNRGVAAAGRRLGERDARVGAMVDTGPIMSGRSADSRAEPTRRMGRMNDYWSEGSAAQQAPFNRAEGGGFEQNPNAAPGGDLFPPENAFLRIPDYAVFGGGAAEAALTYEMWRQAEEEETAAEDAFEAERTGANLAILEAARTKTAMWETANRLGLGLMLGRASGLGHRYPTARPPSVGAAESEVALLNEYLAARSARARPRTSQAAPPALPPTPPVPELPALETLPEPLALPAPQRPKPRKRNPPRPGFR